jgi:cysteinyl-tRNA synthetase
MALAHLGETFDVHGGGLDLVFPHHENEIAQSQGALGDGTFARCWMHNGLLNVGDGEKMSKSLGNFWLVSDVRRRYDAEAVRLYLLQAHYRAPIAFEVVEGARGPTLPGVEDAERRLDYFYGTLERIDDVLGPKRTVDPGPVDPDAQRLVASFADAMDDDFNTPAALAELHEAAKAANRLIDEPKSVPKDVRRRSLALLGRDLRAMAGGSLGLLQRPPREFLEGRRARLAASRGLDLAAVESRLRARDDARKAKDYRGADVIRGELLALGVEVMDTPRGADWRIRDGASRPA